MAKKWVAVGEVAPQQVADKESWPKWFGRNIAQGVARPIVGAMGFPGDISEAILSDIGMPKQPERVFPKKDVEPPGLTQRYLQSLAGQAGIDVSPLSEAEEELTRTAPTTQDIMQALSPLIGQQREGDYLATGLTHTLPFLMGRGVPTAANLIRSGLMAGGSYLGGQLGGKVGKEIGGSVGFPQIGGILGGVGGGIAGIKGAQKAYGLARNIPSRVFPEKIEQKLERQRSELAQQRADIPEKIQKYQERASESYKQLDEIVNKKYRGDIQLEVPGLSKKLITLAERSVKGIPELNQKQVSKIFGDIIDDISNNKISLDTARAYVEGLGKTAYEGGLSPAVKNAAKRAREILKNDISGSLQDYPEVKQLWEKADTNYRQFRDLAKKQPKLEKEITAAEKKLEPHREMTDINRLTDIGVKLAGKFTPGLGGYWLAGKIATMMDLPGVDLIRLGGAAAGEIGRQLRTLRGVMKKHPDIYKDWQGAVKQAQQGNITDLAGLIPIVEDLIPKTKKRRKVWKPL